VIRDPRRGYSEELDRKVRISDSSDKRTRPKDIRIEGIELITLGILLMKIVPKTSRRFLTLQLDEISDLSNDFSSCFGVLEC
jgi:hypothetical protein